MRLRPYQLDLGGQVLTAEDNVIAQADTGAGKTSVLAHVTKKSGWALVVAHRNILVVQLSTTLAKHGIEHSVICSKHTERRCIAEHRRTIGREFVNQRVRKVVVISIDTLLARHSRNALAIDVTKPWKILIDEAHHVLDDNKWGRLATIFPNALVHGFTATPCRSDGRSLSRKSKGLFDRIVQADELRQDSVRRLIAKGFLSDFKIYSIPDRVDAGDVIVGKDGEYIYHDLVATYRNHMITMAGDAVDHYRRLANRKQAVVFCLNIVQAKLTARRFRNAGHAAACIHSGMSQVEVSRIFDLFRIGQIQVLTHVDMIGEGVDVPAIEALIMLRKTASFANFRQWIGRALRPEPGKDHAVIIDHCGNVLRHGMPDEQVDWDIDRPPVQQKSNLVSCRKCSFAFKPWLTRCPGCGESHEIPRGGGGVGPTVDWIDYELVEKERMLILKDELERTELRMPSTFSGRRDALGVALHRLQTWFIETVARERSIREANQFFEKHPVSGEAFWTSRFTLADAVNDNRAKALREYDKCRKSA